ncbi:MAG: hypothetical protein U0359_12400 [Byssovorax sp.]
MNIAALVQQFLGSEHGQAAVGALNDQGLGDQANDILHHSVHAGAAHVEDHHKSRGLFGDHAGMSFFAAFASGIVKGDGVLGALEDGVAGVVVGRIAEALQDKMGMDSTAANAAAAATAPYVMSFLKQHLGS